MLILFFLAHCWISSFNSSFGERTWSLLILVVIVSSSWDLTSSLMLHLPWLFWYLLSTVYMTLCLKSWSYPEYVRCPAFSSHFRNSLKLRGVLRALLTRTFLNLSISLTLSIAWSDFISSQRKKYGLHGLIISFTKSHKKNLVFTKFTQNIYANHCLSQ